MASSTPIDETIAQSVPSTDARDPDGPMLAGTRAMSSPRAKPRNRPPPDVT